MCIDIDLFGQVIITYSDVELWLENSVLTPDSIPNRVKGYIKDYDIASKIAHSKLSGQFYDLKPASNRFDMDVIQSAFIKHLEPENKTATGCPPHFHVCKITQCPVFKKRKQTAYNHAMYAKKKAERAAWLASQAMK